MAYSELCDFCKTPAGAALAARLRADSTGGDIRSRDSSRLRDAWRDGDPAEFAALCEYFRGRPKYGAWLMPTYEDLRRIYEDPAKFDPCAAVFDYAYSASALEYSTPHPDVLKKFLAHHKPRLSELSGALTSFAARGLADHVKACLAAGVPPALGAFEAAAARLDHAVLDHLNRRRNDPAARAAELRGAILGGHLDHVESLRRAGAEFAPGMFLIRSGDLEKYRRLLALGCPGGNECLISCASVADARALYAMGGWGPHLDRLFHCGVPAVLDFLRALIADGALFDLASIDLSESAYWPRAYDEFYAWLRGAAARK